MMRGLHLLSLVVFVALVMSVRAPQARVAGPALAPDWCRVDDPAAYMAAARHAHGKVACRPPANAQTLPAEIALPMPCGQAMIFRKIVVGGDSLLDEQTVYLGQPVNDTSALQTISDGPRVTELAGAFTQGNGQRNPGKLTNLKLLHGRSYYIGKYLVTAAQYRAFTSKLLTPDGKHDSPSDPACKRYDTALAQTRPTGVMPASRISWFDAVAFTRAYNNWALARDRARIARGLEPQIPWEQGSPAYVRLPTEAEWEFAARGGAAGRQDLGMETYAVRDPVTGRVRDAQLSEIAELSSPDQFDPEHPLFGVGRKLPNLFGLYDMIGDVDEIMFEPFRLTRPDRLQGQAGGYILKGGNVFTPAAALGVGYRREVPFFTLEGEVRAPTTGFRLVLALPVFVNGMVEGKRWSTGRQNPAELDAMKVALASLVKTGDAGRDALSGELTKLREANQRGKLDNKRLADQLAEIQSGLAASNARLKEEARNVRREKLESATLLAFNIRAIGASVFANLNLVTEYRQQAEKVKAHQAERLRALAKIEAAIEEKNRSLTKSFGLYTQLVLELAKSSPNEIADANDAVKREFAAEGMTFFDKYRGEVLRHVAEAAKLNLQLPKSVQQRWLNKIDDTRTRRDELFKNLK